MTYRLTNKDIADVKGMFDRGDIAQTIATWFQVNPARLYEIKDCDLSKYDDCQLSLRARSIRHSPVDDLPPPPPYIVMAKAFATRLQRVLRDMQARDIGEDE